MELLVSNVLRWRLRALTPCSYIRYFLGKISGYDQEPSSRLISRSLQLIASTTKGERSLLCSLHFGFFNLKPVLLFGYGLSVFVFFCFYDFELRMIDGGCDLWADIDFLEFRASETAAAIALSVSGELHTTHFDKFSFFSFFSHLEKVRKKITKSLF